MTPECSCPVAGYCARHKMEKIAHWHRLCREKEAYRQAWDEGRGPRQKPRGLGDTVEANASNLPAQVGDAESYEAWQASNAVKLPAR